MDQSPHRPREEDLVFNVVWTGTVFDFLERFVASQMREGRARFRFVGNGCPPDQLAKMERFAGQHPDQVVEVLDVSDEMVAHGVALDRVRAQRDDGPWFGLVDPDIKATGPYLGRFLDLLEEGCAAVTSGTEVWTQDNLVPVDHPGVAGEHFFDQDGFVFGSPHFAIYDRRALDATTQRWGVGLGSAGPELSREAKARLAEVGRRFAVYDTGKIVNALLQADGHRLVHEDAPTLLHIGGLSHFLAPTHHITLEDGEVAPEWARWGISDRYHVTKFTALTLHRLLAHEPAPPVPDGVDPELAERLALVQRELEDLFAD
jgi:hypothetical protein